MALKYKTQAFVFKKNDINESDRFFSVFTKDFGRLELKAKAIRKIASKLRASMDMFYLSEVKFIHGQNAKTLTDAQALEKFDNVFQDLEKFKTANGIGELLDNFIKGQEKDEAIFNLVKETFVRLNNFKFKISNLKFLPYYYFLWNFLSLLGYKPEVGNCSICHDKLNPYYLYFSEKLGGVICKKCLNHDMLAQRINSDIVKVLRLVLGKDWQTMSKLKVEPSSQKLFQKISDSYQLYILLSNSFKNS